jgi:carbamoyltransferase
VKKILGISAFYHDSAAAIIEGGKILAAAQEERFTRKKHDKSFPSNACRFCLEHSGFNIDELDAVVFYDKPLLKFERLLETYYQFAPKGVSSFVTAIPVWLKEKLFLKKMIRDELKKIQPYNDKKLKLLFPEHHLSHAASAYYPSSFNESAIITVDGVGEWATASICYGNGNSIKILKELHFPDSLGLLYSAFTYYLGFRVNSGEYKLMGLAPYGIPGSERVNKYIGLIKSEMVTIYEDGSIRMNQKYFNYATGLRMINEKKWDDLFGINRRKPEEDITQPQCDLALAIQEVTEEIMMNIAREAQKLTRSKNICLAGGVALNCVANGKLLKEKIFENIFIQPASGDAGGSLGAALAANYLYFEQPRQSEDISTTMQGAYFGPEFNNKEIEKTSRKFKGTCRYFADYDNLADEVAGLLDKGNVVGWFQGRMEFGPRALGNRSILGDARNVDMQKKLNLKIKYRESFRPFAPSVMEEYNSEYFDIDTPSPYMLLVADVKKEIRNNIPDNYYELPIRDRLYIKRSDIPAITHIDFSARIQSVNKETNPRYWTLINKFREKTGWGVIVNTSFNVRGEPIVCTPDDAYRCFMRTEMDYLVMGNYLFDKKEQPEWDKNDNWKVDFVLD